MAVLDRRSGTSASTSTSRLAGIRDDLGFKAPCRVATTANITLSGLQTIDGVTVAAGDRVLVRSQTDTTLNGIWNASTGNWTRATDADSNSDLVHGTQVGVTNGTTLARSAWMLLFTDASLALGTTSLYFALIAASPTT